ncbi:MAG: hypothetical protein Q8O07_07335, partial [Chloroflexota bacterium]|nr:hypothetical protein [Chloroflexota bacterium]
TTTSMVFAGVDWDGDPVLSVGGTTVYVDYSFGGGDFILEGGQIRLVAEAPQIRLLDAGPEYIKIKVVSDGQDGHLLLTTSLSRAEVPDTFQVRVRVQTNNGEKAFTFTVKNRETIDFVMPK